MTSVINILKRELIMSQMCNQKITPKTKWRIGKGKKEKGNKNYL